MTLDHVFLHGIEAHGHHGVLDFERRDGQLFVVDVDWWLDTMAAVTSDRIDATVCYKQLHECVSAIITGKPWSLIETLASHLTTTLLTRFEAIEIVKVTVHKPHAPIGGRFADVGITLTRRRNKAGLAALHLEDLI